MNKIEQLIKDITSKNEPAALNAAKYMLDNGDVEMFKLLTQKSQYLFDFIKDNVCKRLGKSVSVQNYKNIFNFFDTYSPDYDDILVSCLAQYANENLTDEMLELLENGNKSQKKYAAKYFSFIPDTIAAESLVKYAFSDSESLSYNAAQALGKMEDETSYKIALDKLSSEDDFDKLKAVKFFNAYAKKAPIEEIFNAMRFSAMPENIAGEIPYIISLVSLFETDNKKNVLIAIDNILSGLGEILPLSQIFQFELYEIFAKLIETNRTENHYESKIAQILLKALGKIKMFCENDEYIFDEDKNTKQELKDILQLLENQNRDFWEKQKSLLLKELTHCRHRICSALEVVKEQKIAEAIPIIKELLKHENEIVVFEAISALKEFDELENIDKNEVLKNIKSENIKAMIENLWR